MKIFFDFLPIVLFFIVYKLYGIYAATFAAIIIAALQFIVHRLIYKKFDKMQLATLIIIAVLGGATIIFHNAEFIKWKPTVLYWVFALAFIGYRLIANKLLIQSVLQNNIILPEAVWKKLNNVWVGFFVLMGIVNLYVAYHYSTNTWVNFKLFGLLGLTILFFIVQIIFLAKHIEETPNTKQIKKEGE